MSMQTKKQMSDLMRGHGSKQFSHVNPAIAMRLSDSIPGNINVLPSSVSAQKRLAIHRIV